MIEQPKNPAAVGESAGKGTLVRDRTSETQNRRMKKGQLSIMRIRDIMKSSHHKTSKTKGHKFKNGRMY